MLEWDMVRWKWIQFLRFCKGIMPTLGLFKFVSDNLFDHQRVSQANWYWGFWLKWLNSAFFSEQRKQLQNKKACTPKEVLFMQMHSGDPFRKRQNRTQCLHLCREESTIFTETVVLKSGSSKMLREYGSGSLIRFSSLITNALLILLLSWLFGSS